MVISKKHSHIYLLISFVVAIALFLILPVSTHAATFNLLSDKDTLAKGDVFNLDIKIDSQDDSVNAAQSTLKFSPDLLEVSEVVRDSSVFNFWLSEPVFDNSAGTVNFIGGSSSGLSGKSLQILKVKFKVKGTGDIKLSLADSAITASDGSGTNILTLSKGLELKSVSQAEVEVVKSEPKVVNKNPVIASKVPAAPVLSIPLYPNPENWYNISSNFLVSWALPKDVVNVSTALNKVPKYDPSSPEGLFDNKSYHALDDGVWYLHVRFKNNIGWGVTNHYKIAIDTVPPLQFNLETDGSNLPSTETIKTVKYNSQDQTSGILAYLIAIDKKTPVDTKETSFTTEQLTPGMHNITVIAQDLAGNKTQTSLPVEVLPIKSPTILSMTKNLFVGEGGLALSGQALPDTLVFVYLKDSKNQLIHEAMTDSNMDGLWSFSLDQPLKIGRYYVQIVNQDKNNGLSMPVSSEFVRVREKPVFTIFGFDVTYKMFSAIALLAFIILLSYKLYSDKQRAKAVFKAERDIDFELTSVEQIVNEMMEINKDTDQDWESQARSNYNLKAIKENLEKKKSSILNEIEDMR